MAQVEAWLWNRLKTYAGIVALNGTKAYAIAPPQGVSMPFITFRRTQTQRDYNTRRNDGVPTATFDINCWDDNYADLKLLTEQVRLAIDGYRIDTDDFDVRKAFIVDEADIPEPAEWGFEQPTYGTQFVLAVTHTETVPTYT